MSENDNEPPKDEDKGSEYGGPRIDKKDGFRLSISTARLISRLISRRILSRTGKAVFWIIALMVGAISIGLVLAPYIFAW